jgi:hypothetical protein
MPSALPRKTLAVLTLCAAAVQAQPVLLSPDLDDLVRELFGEVATLSSYPASAEPPPIFEVPQRELEQAVCDSPCNVVAAYLPRKGIYLAGHLDPRREPEDRAALLHELVHYLQYRADRFSELAPCERAREEEREAVAIQNAYLKRAGVAKQVPFNQDFGCGE